MLTIRNRQHTDTLKHLKDELGGLLVATPDLTEEELRELEAVAGTRTRTLTNFAFPGIDPVSIGLATLSGLPKIVGAAADVAGYFQGNYTVTGREVAAKNDPLLAALGAALIEHSHCTVTFDGFRVLPESTTESGTFKSVQTLLNVRAELLGQQPTAAEQLVELERIKQEKIDAETAARTSLAAAKSPAKAAAEDVLGKASAERAVASARHAKLKGALDAATNAIAAADAYIDEITKQPTAPDQGLPLLASASLRDLLHTTDSDVLVAAIAISMSGGESRTRQRRHRAETLRICHLATQATSRADHCHRATVPDTKRPDRERCQTCDRVDPEPERRGAGQHQGAVGATGSRSSRRPRRYLR